MVAACWAAGVTGFLVVPPEVDWAQMHDGSGLGPAPAVAAGLNGLAGELCSAAWFLVVTSGPDDFGMAASGVGAIGGGAGVGGSSDSIGPALQAAGQRGFGNHDVRDVRWACIRHLCACDGYSARDGGDVTVMVL
jgi:hypothetical protein